MKKLFTMLFLIAILVAAFPASAKSGERVGDRIHLWFGPSEFPAGEPFHVAHGWTAFLPDEGPVGLIYLTLDVEGIYFDVDFNERGTIRHEQDDFRIPHPEWYWVFNFPDGMEEGTQTITAHWFGSCHMAVDIGMYPGPCEKRNAQVEFHTQSLDVTFTP